MPYPEVKPNIKKVFLMNVVKVVSIVMIILFFIIFFVNMVGGSGFFQDVFGGFGFSVDISAGKLIWWFVLAIAVVTALILILNYLSLGNIRYEFKPDRIVYYSSFLFVLLNSKEVPYANELTAYLTGRAFNLQQHNQLPFLFRFPLSF